MRISPKLVEYNIRRINCSILFSPKVFSSFSASFWALKMVVLISSNPALTSQLFRYLYHQMAEELGEILDRPSLLHS